MASTVSYQTNSGTGGSVTMEFPVEVIVAADKAWIRVSGGTQTPILRGCVPADPFYIRWINRLGGYDYWMWDRRIEIEEQISDVSTVQKYDGGQETIYAEGYTYVTTGAEMLERNTFESLRDIARSPVIEWWNEELQKWLRVVLEKEHSAIWDTRSAFGAIEYTFQLPRLNLQF